MNRLQGTAVLGLALALGACAAEAPPPPATTATTAPATRSMAASPAAAPAGSMVADGDFGVPACDSYMRKYMACIDSKVPEQGRAMMRQSLDQTRAQWKQAASTPQGRDGLAMACAQAETAAKQATAAYGCTW